MYAVGTHQTAITIIVTTKTGEREGDWERKLAVEILPRCVWLRFASQLIKLSLCAWMYLYTACAWFWNYNSTRTNLSNTNIGSNNTLTHTLGGWEAETSTSNNNGKKWISIEKIVRNIVSGKRARNRKLWQHVYVNYLFYHPPKPKGVGISIFKRWNRNDNSTKPEAKWKREKYGTNITHTKKEPAEIENETHSKRNGCAIFCQIYR